MGDVRMYKGKTIFSGVCRGTGYREIGVWDCRILCYGEKGEGEGEERSQKRFLCFLDWGLVNIVS